MAYIVYPSQPEQHNAPHFDKHQFADHGRFLSGSRLDFKDLRRMHLQPIADLRKGRRVGIPTWAASDGALREVLVRYLENRFYLTDRTGTLTERLARCRAAGITRARGARRAKGKTPAVKQWVSTFRLLNEERFSELPEARYLGLLCSIMRGESLPEHQRAVERQIVNLDSEAFVAERAPELVAAIAYYRYRLGWDSPSIAEALSLKGPGVRQILHRLNRTARRQLSRATQPKTCPVSGQHSEKAARKKEGV